MDLLGIRIQLTPTIRIGPGFLCNACIGMLFGPFVAMLAGICTDTLGYLVNSGGAALFSRLYADGYAGRHSARPVPLSGRSQPDRRLVRVVLDKTCINLFCNLGLNTLWLSMLYGDSFLVLLPARAIKNLMMLPFECIALAVVTEAVYQIETKRLRTAHR